MITVVVPTVGRESLARLLDAVADAPRVLVVDDRREPHLPLAGTGAPNVTVLTGPARGPAAARNVGWRAADTEWVAFLDDDVLPPPGWYADLVADLAGCPPEVVGSQGRVVVPLPADRPPTDWERNVAGLERARWATADLAYRRAALAAVGGFDERFPRAYREDADLGLRLTGRGWAIRSGRRWVTHPVRPAGRWVSVRLQAGNADDVLMRRLHGPRWRQRAGAPPGRLPWHLATAAGAAGGVVGALTGCRRLAATGGAAYLLGVADLALRRIRPGPRTPEEIATMVATSAALPLAASWHWASAHWRVRRALR